MYDVVTIGTATQDVFLKSGFFKVLKDPEHLKKLGFVTGEAECFAFGAKIEVEKPVIATGGGALNAAVTFARMGKKTAAFFKVGNDEFGDEIIKQIKKEGVIPLVSKDQKVGTGYSTILLNQNGERTVLVYRGATHTAKAADFNLKNLKTRWAYIAPGDIPISVIQPMVREMKRGGIKIAMNPSGHYIRLGREKIKSATDSLDVIILNMEEASLLTGADYKNQKNIFKKMNAFFSGIVVITDGKKGAFVSDGKYLYKTGIFKEKKVIDRTGAGDAFGSAFVSAFASGQDIHYALRLASANATSVVEHIGAQEGIITENGFRSKRWQYLDLDIEPL